MTRKDLRVRKEAQENRRPVSRRAPSSKRDLASRNLGIRTKEVPILIRDQLLPTCQDLSKRLTADQEATSNQKEGITSEGDPKETFLTRDMESRESRDPIRTPRDQSSAETDLRELSSQTTTSEEA